MKSIGQWRSITRHGREYVFVICPGCGHEYRLNHDISNLGVVTPSVDCPDDDCSFHDTIILAGWRGHSVTAHD